MLIKKIKKVKQYHKSGQIGIVMLKKLSKVVLPEYRFKWPGMDWYRNARFNAYLEKFNEKEGFNTDRRWLISQLMRLTTNVEGHTAECGSYEGAGSYLMCLMNDGFSKSQKTHYIFDSFEGMSKPSEDDGDVNWEKGNMSRTEIVVKENLKEFKHFKLLKGWIPHRFSEVSKEKFSFVHIDVDLYQPTFDSIAFFYDNMNPGGILVCDDYGYNSCPGATKACDDFLKDKAEKMIYSPCGGGFFIKGVTTSDNL